MRAVAALSLLVLALAAGGEARAGDGVSGRQLLTDPKPVSCKDSKCDKVLKDDHCEWLPKADITCKTHDKYKVSVKNCFKKKLDYVSISVDGKCTKYKTYSDDIIAKLDLKCGDKIAIYGYDKYFKGNTEKGCGDDSSSRVAGQGKGNDCKTCMYEAEYTCPYAVHKPGDKCRDAKGDCEKDAVFDDYCRCPKENPLRNSDYMCRKHTGKCDKDTFCDGHKAECPPKEFHKNTKVCRRSYGECDMPELCTGSSADCPMNMFKPNTTECRKAKPDDLCDEPEFCTGTSAKCPKDGFKPAHTKCREAKGVCDVDDYCSGYGPKCEDKVVEKEAKKECRPAAGPCDAAEYCDGYSKDCGKDYCLGYKKELMKDEPYCPTA